LTSSKHLLEVGLQQNYDIGLEGLRVLLRDSNAEIKAERFIKIVENFYNVNLFIFLMTDKKIDILKPYNYRNYYYSFEDTIKKNPIVFLINFQNVYELIAFEEEDTIKYDVSYFKEYKDILYYSYGSFYSDKFITMENIKAPSKCQSLITHQIIDAYGKTRLLVFANKYMAITHEPIMPLSAPVLKKSIDFCDFSEVQSFLNSHSISFEKIYRYEGLLIAQINDFIPLYFLIKDKIEITAASPPENLQILFRIVSNLQKKEALAFKQVQQNMRLVHALMDICLYYFSKFIKESEQGDVIRDFIHEKISFSNKLPYRSILDLSPRLDQEIVLHDDRLQLPRSIETKLAYFLKWFLNTNKNILIKYHQLVEIPSFYQFSSDFQFRAEFLIQTQLEFYNNQPFSIVENKPLDEIKHPNEQFFYYYNPKYTPQNRPYLTIIFREKRKGIEFVSNYVKDNRYIELYPPNYKSRLDSKFYIINFKKDFYFLI
jgi:hypothetical protein